MTPNLFMALCLLALLVWFGYIIVTIFRSEKLSKATLTRIEEHPQDIDRVRLMDQDRIYISVRFRGEDDVELTIAGLAAVRLYDKLGIIAPQAIRTVTRGGKPVPAEA
jgi:hypothetical protein